MIDKGCREREHRPLHSHLAHAGYQTLDVEKCAVESIVQPADAERDALAARRAEAN